MLTHSIWWLMDRVAVTENGCWLWLGATNDLCIRGHEFTSENTRIQARSGGRVMRVCRTCHRDKERKRYRGRCAHS